MSSANPTIVHFTDKHPAFPPTHSSFLPEALSSLPSGASRPRLDLYLYLRDKKSLLLKSGFFYSLSSPLELEFLRHREVDPEGRTVIPMDYSVLAVQFVVRWRVEDWWCEPIDPNDTLFGSPLPEALRFASQFSLLPLQHHLSNLLKSWASPPSPGFLRAIRQVATGKNPDPYLRRYLGQLIARNWSVLSLMKDVNVLGSVLGNGPFLLEVLETFNRAYDRQWGVQRWLAIGLKWTRRMHRLEILDEVVCSLVQGAGWKDDEDGEEDELWMDGLRVDEVVNRRMQEIEEQQQRYIPF